MSTTSKSSSSYNVWAFYVVRRFVKQANLKCLHISLNVKDGMGLCYSNWYLYDKVIIVDKYVFIVLIFKYS